MYFERVGRSVVPLVPHLPLARATWERRKELFAGDAKRNGVEFAWSLTHPFDDLTESEMTLLPDVLDTVEWDGLERWRRPTGDSS